VLIPDSPRAVLLQPGTVAGRVPAEILDKDKKLMVYLPAAPLRSFGEARQAGSKARL